MRYPGGKGTTYAKLLNVMPPHSTYVETHLGGGALMRKKRPAARQIGIDVDAAVMRRWQCDLARDKTLSCELICADAVEWLQAHPLEPTALIYADPPYVSATRRRDRIYRHDYTDSDHVRLIDCLKSQRCMVMISGYRSDLYDRLLDGWRQFSFSAMTHTGVREETVWFNFAPPECLHDVHHLGDGFRQREVFRRRRARLHDRITRLPTPEQHGLLQWLQVQLGRAQ